MKNQLKVFILERDKCCQYCNGGNAWVVEHVVPKTFGGHDEPYNLVGACDSCNTIKKRAVWIPRNLNAITTSHPEWKERIMREADTAGQAFFMLYGMRRTERTLGMLLAPKPQITCFNAFLVAGLPWSDS